MVSVQCNVNLFCKIKILFSLFKINANSRFSCFGIFNTPDIPDYRIHMYFKISL